MTLPTRAVDASYDPLTAAEAACLKESGWPVFWQCLWTGRERPAVAISNLRVAFQAGLRIGAYISLTSQGSGSGHVDVARLGVPDDLWYKLDFVAVDVELPGILLGEVLNAVTRVRHLGRIPMLYTSYNAWLNYVTPGNSSAVADRSIPLINALWDEHPDFDFPALPYGGWNDVDVFMEQWSGGTTVCGQFVDRNTIVHPEIIYGIEEEEEMTFAEDIAKDIHAIRSVIYDQAVQQVALRKEVQALRGIVYDQAVRRALLEELVELHEARLDRTEVVVPALHSENATKAFQSIRDSLSEIEGALDNHVHEHNQSGGALDRSSGAFINRLAHFLTELERQLSLINTTTLEGE